MKIHYLNAQGEEKFIDNIIHLQNIDNYTWVATAKGGKELTLKTERIEGIADIDMIKNMAKHKKQYGVEEEYNGWDCWGNDV